jgi:hypothetical protein
MQDKRSCVVNEGDDAFIYKQKSIKPLQLFVLFVLSLHLAGFIMELSEEAS